MTPIDHKSREEQRRIRERQAKELERTDEYESPYVMTRSADFSVFARIGYWLDRYKVLWYLIVTVLLAVGFDYKTPAMHYKELRDRIVALEQENRAASEARVKIDKKLDALLLFECFRTPARDLALADVDCSKLPSLKQ